MLRMPSSTGSDLIAKLNEEDFSLTTSSMILRRDGLMTSVNNLTCIIHKGFLVSELYPFLL